MFGNERLLCQTWLSHFSFRHRLLEAPAKIPRSETLTDPVTNVTENNQIPLVLTFHTFNLKLETSLGRIFIF